MKRIETKHEPVMMNPATLFTANSTVHMVGKGPFKLKLGEEVQTRCGLMCTPVESEPPLYMMTNQNGGDFRGTTLRANVTCRKCRNLFSTGTIHAPKR